MAFPQTGLTQLGQAISGGARDFSRRKLALQDESRLRDQSLADDATLRSQRLEDITSERAFNEDRFDRQLQAQGSQSIALELVRTGFLDPSLMNDTPSVQAAFEASTTRSEAERITRLEGEEAESTFALEQRGNAQKVVDSLYTDMTNTRQRIVSAEQKVNNRPVTDPSEVNNLALRLAQAQYEDESPTPVQIEGMTPQARSQIEDRDFQLWNQGVEEAKIQLQLLKSQLVSQGRQIAQFADTFGVAPSLSNLQEPAAPVVPAGGSERIASPEQIQAAMAAAIQSSAPPPLDQQVPPPSAPVSAGARLLENPAADPIVTAENERRTSKFLGEQNEALRAPWLQAVDALAGVDAQIESARKGSGGAFFKPSGPSGVFGIPAPFVPGSPSMKAQEISNLLVKKQALKREVDKQQRLMLGLSDDALLPSQIAAPTISTQEGSIPAEFAFPDQSQVGR